MSVVFYQVELQIWDYHSSRETTDCGKPERDREASIMRGPRPDVCAM